MSTCTPTPTAEWRVSICGEKGALLALAEALRDSDPWVAADGDRFWLGSRTFVDLVDEREVHAKACEILNALSAVARMDLGASDSIELGIVERFENGKRHLYLFGETGHFNVKGSPVSMKIVREDGTVEYRRPADGASSRVKAAIANQEAAKALRLRAAGPTDWADLYRIYEVIEHAVGGQPKIVSRGWASGKRIERFCRTAGSPAAAGDAARHGVQKGDPPSKPMTISEGQELVDHLLRSWTDLLAEKTGA